MSNVLECLFVEMLEELIFEFIWDVSDHCDSNKMGVLRF